jgi:cell division protein FtsB
MLYNKLLKCITIVKNLLKFYKKYPENKMTEKTDKNSSNVKVKEEKVRNINFLVTLLLLVCLIPIVSGLYHSYSAKSLLHKEKVKEEQHLKREVDYLKDKTASMSNKEEYLKTLQGVESVAREKLGLTKPNEIPIVLKNKEETPVEEISTEEEIEKQENENSQ